MAAARQGVRMGQKAFVFDMTSCTGCRCCQVACKERHDLPVGVFYRRVADFEGGAFPAVWAASLSSACNHCDAPQCANNCPVLAPQKDLDTGLVVQDTDMCIGCGKCIVSCPYGVPAYNPVDDTVRKCDGCIALVRAGERPVCVAACSTRALRFMDAEEVEGLAISDRLTKDLACLPSSETSSPNTFILPKDEMRAL